MERAQKIADEAVAAGITDLPAGSSLGLAGRSDGGMRKRVGGFGQVDSGGSGGGGGGGAVAMMAEDLAVLVVLGTSTRKAKSVRRARYHARYSVSLCSRDTHDGHWLTA